MAEASYAQTSFHGGEVSPLNQGRFDSQVYRTFLNVCLNSFPTENGSMARRTGSRWAGTTRGGAPGRLIKFDIKQATPFQLEFTDGHLRFWQGTILIAANSALVMNVSSADPAVVNANLDLATGQQVYFINAAPGLQGRVFSVVHIDSTHFSLVDAISGAPIDGSTIGASSGQATVVQVLDVPTPYGSGTWSSVRAVQSETQAVLLQGGIPTQILQFISETAPRIAAFSLAPASFVDGPYLDPFSNGTLVTPNQKTGIVTLTISFQPYVATTAYQIGDFVSSAAVNYISLVDQNVGSVPPSANWSATNTSAAINNGMGFLGTDIGRLVRLYSIPAAWAAGSVYASGAVVSYNPTGAPGAETFWQSLVNANTGNVPGTDLTHWGPVTTGAALWTWGKITSLANEVLPATGTAIGSMTGGGGLAAAFDGVTNQAGSASASQGRAAISPSTTLDGYVGKDYSGAGGQAVDHSTLYPSNDIGFATQDVTSSGGHGGGVTTAALSSLVINLRGKASAPVNAADGTLLGTTGAISNSTTAINIISSDKTTAWNFVWFEIVATWNVISTIGTVSIYAAEAQFFAPPGTGAGNAINVELLGPALLYTTSITTWRLGVYSNTTGWPTCGCYDEGRIWLAGAIPNRFDACVANGFSGNDIDFAPTEHTGVVTAASGISGTFTADSANPVFWMRPDLLGIIVGTQAAEYLITAPTAGGFSPFNIAVRRATNVGCANVEPRHTEHTTIFVQRYGRKIIEYFPDVFSGKYTAPNLAQAALHLTRNGIVELAYQQAVTPIIWARDSDGNLLGITYKRDTLSTAQGPTFAGWHRHVLGSGRVVESISVGPSIGGDLDTLTMITNDPATGVRHVELITDEFDEQAVFTQAWYLDDASSGTSYSASSDGVTVNGLFYLEGQTVQAWIAGIDCGLQEDGLVSDFTVANGSIFVPFGDGTSGSGAGKFTAELVATFSPLPIVVGFTYNSDVQLVRPMKPEESGARTGPALAKKRRTEQYGMLITNAGMGLGTLVGAGVLVGTSFDKMFPALFKRFQGSSTNISSELSFAGVHWDSLGKTESDLDNMFCWRVTRPYPCNVAAVELFLRTQDK